MLRRVFTQSGVLILEVKSKCRGYFQKELLWRDTEKEGEAGRMRKKKLHGKFFPGCIIWLEGNRGWGTEKKRSCLFFWSTGDWREVVGSGTGVLLLLLKFLRDLISVACSSLKRLTHLWEGKNISTGQILEIWFISIFLALLHGALPQMVHEFGFTNCFLLQRPLISSALFSWHAVITCFYCLTVSL